MIFEINTWTSLVFFFVFAVIVSFAILFRLLKSLVIYFVLQYTFCVSFCCISLLKPPNYSLVFNSLGPIYENSMKRLFYP